MNLKKFNLLTIYNDKLTLRLAFPGIFSIIVGMICIWVMRVRHENLFGFSEKQIFVGCWSIGFFLIFLGIFVSLDPKYNFDRNGKGLCLGMAIFSLIVAILTWTGFPYEGF